MSPGLSPLPGMRNEQQNGAHRSMNIRCLLVVLLAGTAAALSQPTAARSPTASKPACDRTCLYGFADRYLDALAHRDAARLPWAAHARYTENNVELAVGDGIWGTATKLGDYRLEFADVGAGQVGVFGVVQETDDRSGFALRLKIEHGRIAEAEMIVVRLADFGALGGGTNPFVNARFFDKPILEATLAPGQGSSRERMIGIANGYFDTLQRNDGRLFTRFDPQCERYEDGILTTNNPAKTLGPLTAYGCERQFRLGGYRFDDRVRDRRFPLVDRERGLVLAAGFIDHTGRMGDFRLTDGSIEHAPVRRPHSFCYLELFKIVNGRIRQVESVFITVPYDMPSPWVG
ncbi:MAG TPA: hypothetical protein VMB48_12750 [Steroidobacteraceae bacterium]|nr:hypothetical protein [Steroidobacteraceae bacterium]